MGAKNIFLKIFEIVLIIYLLICFVAVGMWTYLKFFAPERKTELVTYLNPIKDINGKTCVVKASLYENLDNSGTALLDVKLSGYSDINATNIVSFGVQVIGNFNDLVSGNDIPLIVDKTNLGFAKTTNYTYTFIGNDTRTFGLLNGFKKGVNYGKVNSDAGRLCFYEESDELSYINVNSAFDDFGSIRVKIDKKMYAFEFGYALDSISYLGKTDNTTSSLSLFIKNIYEQLKTAPIGESKHTFGYKDMFKVYEVKNGQYSDITIQDDIYNYCYIDFTHYTTGAKTANDSLFKQVSYNTNWCFNNDNSLLDEHFSDKTIFNITEQDCKFTYNTQINKHQFDISETFYETYKNSNLNLKLVLDLDYLYSINVAFGGIKENSLLRQMGVKSYYTQQNELLTEVLI